MSRYFNKCRQSLVQEMWTSEAQHKQYLAIYFPRSTHTARTISLRDRPERPHFNSKSQPRGQTDRERDEPPWV